MGYGQSCRDTGTELSYRYGAELQVRYIPLANPAQGG